MSIVKKGAVAIDGRIFPFVKHRGNRLLLQQRMQRRTFAVLHAVIGPERLRQAIELSLGIRFDLMLAGEAAVVCRVPVLAGDNGFAAGETMVDKSVGDIYGAITFRYGKCAARSKIVL